MTTRLNKIMTKSGDDGMTYLADGERLKKSHIRIHVMGEIDELNSQLGMLHSLVDHENIHEVKELIMRFQHDLFDLGADISMNDVNLFNEEKIEFLEECISHYNKTLSSLENFILPSGSILIAQTHITRSICRRAERHMVAYLDTSNKSKNGLIYLNRLSDLLFILVRYIAKKQKIDDIIWQQRKPT